MKKHIFLIPLLFLIIGCTSDDSNTDTINVTVSIEANGLSDDKLAQNNTANFTAVISGLDGDVSSLSYRWTLTTNNGELSDGVNPLPSPSVSANSINCIGKTAGEEEITVEVLDASNTALASASYSFTILAAGGGGGSFGCFDQPKFIYRKGTFNFVLNFDGTNEESLGIGGGTNVDVSPDGEWIAQARDTPTGWQMNIFRCDGSTGLIPIELTYDPLDNNPTFSLDSKKLYFTRAVPVQEDFEFVDDIFSYDLETGILNNIANLAQQGESVLGGITISPVTGDIAFQRQIAATGEVKLAFLQPESGLITDFYTFPEGDAATSLDWSPNGGDIIFSAELNSTPGIYRINLTSGSQPLLVYENTSLSFDVLPGGPTYYNNGNRIAWTGPALLNGSGQSGTSMFSIDANGDDFQLLLDANASLLLLYGVLR